MTEKLSPGFAAFGPTTERVRVHYERFPYPPCDPADEATRLVHVWLGDLLKIRPMLAVLGNTAAREGRPLTVLDAGCGTGDGAIYLAWQGALVWALDVSAHALAICQNRANKRGLTIPMTLGSLLDLPRRHLGAFDYVLCSGVLHHLDDPLAGLRALASVLKPGGMIGLMVYAEGGRYPVYQIQQALRALGHTEPAQVEDVLTALPAEHWWRLGRGRQTFSTEFEMGDAGVADLFLHPCDHAFTIPALAALVKEAGLAFCGFEPEEQYWPWLRGATAPMWEKTKPLGIVEQAALAEALDGRMLQHRAYLWRPPESA